MKIFLAGNPGIIRREKKWLRLAHTRLLSYWDIQQDQFGVPEAFEYIKMKNTLKNETIR